MPNILGVNLAVSSYDEVVNNCVEWAKASEPHTVLFANVHMLMEAHDAVGFRSDRNSDWLLWGK